MICTEAHLTTTDRELLTHYEAVIERGLQSYVEVGTALAEIRDSRLYREMYGTFEAYCAARWKLKRSRAYQFIEAATVVQNFGHDEDAPKVESHARKLSELDDPAEQRAAWAEACRESEANNRPVTAAAVEEAVRRRAIVTTYTGNYEWYTPSEYIEAAKGVLGRIDLDPASCEFANQTVGARRYFTADDDGLTKDWQGRVWLNPPYSREFIAPFVNKLIENVGSNVPQAILLVTDSTDTNWWQAAAKACDGLCHPRRRIRFYDPTGKPSTNNTDGSCFFYFGSDSARFVEVFSQFGYTHAQSEA